MARHLPVPYFNSVIGLAAGHEAQVAPLLAWYRENGVAPRFEVVPGLATVELCRELARLGCFQSGFHTSLICEPHTSGPQGMAVEKVTQATLDEFLETHAAGWGMRDPPASRPTRAAGSISRAGRSTWRASMGRRRRPASSMCTARSAIAQPAHLRALIADDELTLRNLVALFRHTTLARALGLSVPEYRLLSSLSSAPLFPAAAAATAGERARRLLELVELVEELRASGFSADELAICVGAAPLDANAERQRRLDRGRWLAESADESAGHLGVAEAHVSEDVIRGALAAAGWLPGVRRQVLAPGRRRPGLVGRPSGDVPGGRRARACRRARRSPSLPRAGTGTFELAARLEALAATDAQAGVRHAEQRCRARTAHECCLAGRGAPGSMDRDRGRDRPARALAAIARAAAFPDAAGVRRPRSARIARRNPSRLRWPRRRGNAGRRLDIRGFLSDSQRRELMAWAAAADERLVVLRRPGRPAPSPRGAGVRDGASSSTPAGTSSCSSGSSTPDELVAFLDLAAPRFHPAIQALATRPMPSWSGVRATS